MIIKNSPKREKKRNLKIGIVCLSEPKASQLLHSLLSARKTKQQNITSLKPIPCFAVIKAKFKSKLSHFHHETLAITETNSQASSQL